MQILNVIKQTFKGISQGLSLTVLERGNFSSNAYTPALRNDKK